MSGKVGVLRRGDDLRAALADLNTLTSEIQFDALGEAEYEVLNLLTLGPHIAKCALLRAEPRGVHLRDSSRSGAHLAIWVPRVSRLSTSYSASPRASNWISDVRVLRSARAARRSSPRRSTPTLPDITDVRRRRPACGSGRSQRPHVGAAVRRPQRS